MNFKITKSVFLFLVAFSIQNILFAQVISDKTKALDDLNILKQRLIENIIPNINQPLNQLPPNVLKMIQSQNEDGSWTEVNYLDKSKAKWPPIKHLEYTLELSSTFHSLNKNKVEENSIKQLKKAINNALTFWLIKNPQSDNWWWNVIATPEILGKISILIENELDTYTKDQIIKMMFRADPSVLDAKIKTGQNLVWVAGITANRGILEKKPQITLDALMLIANEIYTADTKSEGIQADFSFHQHGKQIYNGGYGAGFIADQSRYAAITEGTIFQFPSEKTTLLSNFLLDGSRWMIYKNITDFNTVGREIVRKTDIKKKSYLSNAAFYLKNLKVPKQNEIAKFYEESTKNENSLVGNKHFWLSDYMSHKRRDFMVSVKMSSIRMQTGEDMNGEGKKSLLVADGVSFIYNKEGVSYSNLFPILDWKILPGVTYEHSDKPLANVNNEARGISDYSGGVSDGNIGACAFKYERTPLHANKAWFFFDEGCVALGTGIDCDDESPVFTSINQCFLSGDVWIKKNGEITKNESISQQFDQTPNSVYHDGIVYGFMDKQQVILKTEKQTGSWSEISSSASKDKISKNVFSLYLNHGTNVKNGKYAYWFAPSSLEDWKKTSNSAFFTILENDPKLQAIKTNATGIIQAVFYTKGKVNLTESWSISVESPCILLLKPSIDKLTISVSNPLNKGGKIKLISSKPLKGNGVTQNAGKSMIEINLPEGLEAGKTITQIFDLQP